MGRTVLVIRAENPVPAAGAESDIGFGGANGATESGPHARVQRYAAV